MEETRGKKTKFAGVLYSYKEKSRKLEPFSTTNNKNIFQDYYRDIIRHYNFVDQQDSLLFGNLRLANVVYAIPQGSILAPQPLLTFILPFYTKVFSNES